MNKWGKIKVISVFQVNKTYLTSYVVPERFTFLYFFQRWYYWYKAQLADLIELVFFEAPQHIFISCCTTWLLSLKLTLWVDFHEPDLTLTLFPGYTDWKLCCLSQEDGVRGRKDKPVKTHPIVNTATQRHHFQRGLVASPRKGAHLSVCLQVAFLVQWQKQQ